MERSDDRKNVRLTELLIIIIIIIIIINIIIIIIIIIILSPFLSNKAYKITSIVTCFYLHLLVLHNDFEDCYNAHTQFVKLKLITLIATHLSLLCMFACVRFASILEENKSITTSNNHDAGA